MIHLGDPAPTGGRTAVLGLGNPVLSDDAVGLAVVVELGRLLAQDPIAGVDILVSLRAGFEIIDLLGGYGRAIVIDCLTLPDPCPGRVRHLCLDDVSGCARLINAHSIDIGTAFRLAEQVGIPMPPAVDLIAIEAGDTITISENMTSEVAAAVLPLARALHQELKRTAPATAPADGEEFLRRRALYSPGLL
jgi:hydrogenase maturation protease